MPYLFYGKIIRSALGAVKIYHFNLDTMLYIFAGLPASGKTSLAKKLARKFNATYIRVNPIALTRKWWRNAALQTDNPFIEIEVICSDIVTHKGRISDRGWDWDWARVADREYEVFKRDIIQIDTAFANIDQSVQELLSRLGENGE